MVNVFLKPEAYARLKAAKKKNQSFSDVVIENIHQKADLSEFFGSCKGIDAEKIKAQIKADRRHRMDG